MALNRQRPVDRLAELLLAGLLVQPADRGVAPRLRFVDFTSGT
jgi:hypothetical protein